MSSITYPLDLTGNSSGNRVTGEIYTLAPGAYAFVPAAGPFFTESLNVYVDSTNQLLAPNVDYKALYLNRFATKDSGKQVCQVIWVTNLAITGNLRIEYNCVGGPYSTTVTAIQQVLTQFLLTQQPVYWAQILDKPSLFTPVNHLQHINSIVGWDEMIFAIEGLRQAILTGDGAIQIAIYNYVNTAIANSAVTIGDLNSVTNSLTAHVANQTNPHVVTAAQVGLGNVQNWSPGTTLEHALGTAQRYATTAGLQAVLNALTWNITGGLTGSMAFDQSTQTFTLTLSAPSSVPWSNLTSIPANVSELAAFTMPINQLLSTDGSGHLTSIPESSLTITSGQVSDFISAVESLIPPGVGFTPVQQGGGVGQLSNKVYIGWSGSYPKMTVDLTDLGNIAMQDWVTGQNYVTSGALSSTLSGYVTSGTLTSALTPYATESWVGSQGYLTSVSWGSIGSIPAYVTALAGLSLAGNEVLVTDGSGNLEVISQGLLEQNLGTGVSPFTAGSASHTSQVTINAQGRVTALADYTIGITASQVSDFNAAVAAQVSLLPGRLVDIQIFNAAGAHTWTKPSGLSAGAFLIIEGAGGGGGGGQCQPSNGTVAGQTVSIGLGGVSGGYGKVVVPIANVTGASLSVTVGTGGSPGNNGGDSIVDFTGGYHLTFGGGHAGALGGGSTAQSFILNSNPITSFYSNLVYDLTVLAGFPSIDNASWAGTDTSFELLRDNAVMRGGAPQPSMWPGYSTTCTRSPATYFNETTDFLFDESSFSRDNIYQGPGCGGGGSWSTNHANYGQAAAGLAGAIIIYTYT